ncbi:MAG: hypothetical protein PWR30_212 [Candidatus Woesearchaeota archaeon]|nr:hypothetical protein [Candidatus Woesearchaeota archaeon]
MSSLEYNFEHLYLKGVILPHQSSPGAYRKGILVKNTEKNNELYLAYLNKKNYDVFGSDGLYFGRIDASEMPYSSNEFFNLASRIIDSIEANSIAYEMPQINLRMRERDDFTAEKKLEELINSCFNKSFI